QGPGVEDRDARGGAVGKDQSIQRRGGGDILMRLGRIGALIPALLLALLGLLSFLNRASSLHAEDGVAWVKRGELLEAASIQEGGPGDLADIRRGDRLLSVSGVAPSATRNVRELLWGREGQPTHYGLQRGTRRVEAEVLPRPDGEENR